MNDQKDTSKNSGSREGFYQRQSNVFIDKDVTNKDVYAFVFKKTEKIVTALYMVTDCMDTDDAIKVRMRSCGVELLSAVHKISVLSPVEKHTHLTLVSLQINELISLLQIAYMIGYISEMNAGILKKEFAILITELESHQKQSTTTSTSVSLFENRKVSDFVLSDDMFKTEEGSVSEKNTKDQNSGLVFGAKRTLSLSRGQSSIGDKKSAYGTTLGVKNANDFLVSKQERSDKIKALIKDKGDVSIKDISVAFSDCSEKTIQRELNSLISLGQIKKIGEKRWSRYQVI